MSEGKLASDMEALEGFLIEWASRETEEGYSPKTVFAHGTRVRTMVNVLLDHERSANPLDWTVEDARVLHRHWTDKGLMSETKKGYMYTFRAFADECGNPEPSKFKFRWGQNLKTDPQWLTLQEAIRILHSPMTPLQDMGIRGMLRMGRRRGEMIRALTDHMHPDASNPYMDVIGKGGRTHRMPFADGFDRSLGKYLDYRIGYLTENLNDHVAQAEAIRDLMICNSKGRIGGFDIVDAAAYDYRIVAKLSMDLGMHITNHACRRTFGRELYYTGGLDIVTIQQYYNHVHTDQTVRYIGADMRRMADGIKRLPF